MDEVNVQPVDGLPARVKGKNRRTDWAAIARRVKENAPRWCNVGSFNPTVATHIRQGKYPAVDSALYEVTTRKTQVPPGEPRSSSLFMRYIGP